MYTPLSCCVSVHTRDAEMYMYYVSEVYTSNLHHGVECMQCKYLASLHADAGVLRVYTTLLLCSCSVEVRIMVMYPLHAACIV